MTVNANDPMSLIAAFALWLFSFVATLVGIWQGSYEWIATGLTIPVLSFLFAKRS